MNLQKYNAIKRNFFKKFITRTLTFNTNLIANFDKRKNNTMTKKVIIIEPFYGGSHKQLIDFLQTLPNLEIELHTLPAKKWHWRARTSALYLSQVIPKIETMGTNRKPPRDILFCSSVLNLCELCSLRPDLMEIPKKIVFFHENQLAYPVQSVKERDYQYGYNNILTCLTADQVVFNSEYNLNSFLDHMKPFLNIQPSYKADVEKIKAQIQAKSKILYFPVKLHDYSNRKNTRDQSKPLHILWPHRWEHDKNPLPFFQVLFKLKEETDHKFQISILGEKFEEIPPIFDEAKVKLSKEILHFGWVENKEEYFEILSEADVVISTTNHEFFGVAMLEAASCGCLPLVPNRLVYPELYPKNPCLYNTDQQLFKKLKMYCHKPYLARHHWPEELAQEICSKYSTESSIPQFLQIFGIE